MVGLPSAPSQSKFFYEKYTLEELSGNIIPGPAFQTIKSSKIERKPNKRPLKLVTIGRFVPFKISLFKHFI
jgi:hypothetical protein